MAYLKTAVELAMDRTATAPAVRVTKSAQAQADRARLRIAALWQIERTGDGEWTATHREQEVEFRLRRGDRPGLLLVTSDSGAEYRIDWHTASCSCPDHAQRGRCCKHLATATALASFCEARRAERAAAGPVVIGYTVGGGRITMERLAA